MSVQPSRRAVITGTVAGAAVLGSLASQASAQTGSRPLPVSADQALHAARRLSFGATPDLVAHLRSIGLAAWLDEQLVTTTDAHATLSAPQSALPLPAVAVDQLTMHDLDQVNRLQVDTFARAVWGDNQLLELLVEFWSNHLSIRAATVGALKVVDDHEVVRAHALGTFTDMLLASCQSPAMLRYLSNDVSMKPWPNENYARELMELHTVGAQAGYRASDVHDAAKALTGLTIDPRTQQFVFKPEWHVTGRLRVMSWTHPNNDASKGLDVATSLVRYLASHPSTATRLATKLVRRFVGEPVPAALVASAARTYLSNGTSIIPVVKHILLSKDFAHSVGRKRHRPYEWVTSAARSLGLQQNRSMLENGGSVVPMLQRLGQAPFAWAQPNGYPDVTEAWASTASMLARWNTAQALVHGGIAGFKPLDAAALIGTPIPTTAGGLVDRLMQRLLSIPARPAVRSALLHAIGMSATKQIDSATAQTLTPQLAALVLSSPEAMVR